MTAPRIGSLFSGYGGLEQGVQQALGGEVVWHSEIDPAASRILAHHYPNVPNLGDISRVDWTTVPPVDVLVGGFPCQDVSSAGRRAGLGGDGARSGLWVEMAAAIAALRPELVVIENVRGLLTARAERPPEAQPVHLGPSWLGATDPLDPPDDDEDPDADTTTPGLPLGPADADMGPPGGRPVLLRALGAVVGSLADLGYDTWWTTLRASDVGAPHQRARVFIVAWPAPHADDDDAPVGTG